jgi:release factor glutamine methyltransferase
LSGLDKRLSGKIDVLLFNPPYVPCETEELTAVLHSNEEFGIDAAWAGGKHGREVLDKLLPVIKVQPCFKKILNIYRLYYRRKVVFI